MKIKIFFAMVSAVLILSGCASSQSLALLSQYKSQYPRPQYVSASSCVSGKDALRNLVEQLQVTVDASSLLVQEHTNLSESTTAKNVVRLRSGEHLRGLIVRHYGGHCVFVAINKKNATESYQRDVKEESRKIGHLFAKLEEPGATSLEKLRAAKKLEHILKTLRADHDALELLSEQRVHRLHISAYRMRELDRARSFAVYGQGPTANDVLQAAIAAAGYHIVSPLGRPAFIADLTVMKTELPLTVLNGTFPFDVTTTLIIKDGSTGQVLRHIKAHGVMRFQSIFDSNMNTGIAESVYNGTVLPSLQSLSEGENNTQEAATF